MSYLKKQPEYVLPVIFPSLFTKKVSGTASIPISLPFSIPSSGIRNGLKEQGVGVIGIVLDAVKEDGSRDEEAVEKAGLLAERTGDTVLQLL